LTSINEREKAVPSKVEGKSNTKNSKYDNSQSTKKKAAEKVQQDEKNKAHEPPKESGKNTKPGKIHVELQSRD
jgi:hypothetical protein